MIDKLIKNNIQGQFFAEYSVGFGVKTGNVFVMDCSPADGIEMKIENGERRESKNHKVLFREYLTIHNLRSFKMIIDRALEFYEDAIAAKKEEKPNIYDTMAG